MYNPNEARVQSGPHAGEWTSGDATAAIQKAASDKKGFVEAKTIEEAEKFAEENLINPDEVARVARSKAEAEAWLIKNPTGRVESKMKTVDYKGIPIDVANSVNKKLMEEIEISGTPKLNAILSKQVRKENWTARMSSGGDLELNSKYFKKLDIANSDGDTIAEFKKITPYLEANEARLTGVQKAMFKQAKEAIKFTDSAVSKTNIEVITHEMGHHIDNNLKKIIIAKGKDYAYATGLLSEAMKESNVDAHKYKISYYAFSNIFHQRPEVFAESYALYRKGEFSRLSPKTKEFFNYIK